MCFGLRIGTVLIILLSGSWTSHAASTTGSFSVGITIGHTGKNSIKPYRGAVSHFVPVRPDVRQRYTCAAAEIGLRRKGFRRIFKLDCRGSIYRYGARRLGQTVMIDVSSHSGKILAVRD